MSFSPRILKYKPALTDAPIMEIFMRKFFICSLLGSFIFATPLIALAQHTPCPTTSQELFWQIYPPSGSTDYFVVVRWNVVVVGSANLDLSLSGNTLHVKMNVGSFGVPPGPMPTQAAGAISLPAGRYVVQIDPFNTVGQNFPASKTCPAPFPIPLDVPAGPAPVATPVDSLSKLGLLLLGGLLAISGFAVRLRRIRHG